MGEKTLGEIAWEAWVTAPNFAERYSNASDYAGNPDAYDRIWDSVALAVRAHVLEEAAGILDQMSCEVDSCEAETALQKAADKFRALAKDGAE